MLSCPTHPGMQLDIFVGWFTRLFSVGGEANPNRAGDVVPRYGDMGVLVVFE